MAVDKAITYLKKNAPKGEFLAYINPKEAAMLKKAGGSGKLVNGIPSFRPQDMGNKSNQKSSASRTSSSSKSSSKGTGGSKGNLGGGGGGQNTPYRSYKAPTKKTYTAKTIDSKPVTGNDYRDSKQQFIDKVNKDNRIAAAQNNTRFTPYQGGSRMQRSPGGLGNLLKLAMGGAFPGAGLLMGGLNKFGKMGKGIGEGITSLNDKIQNSDFGRSTSLMDYLDARKYGGVDARDRASSKNMREAKGIQKAMDLRYAPQEIGLVPQKKPTFSDPFRNTVGTTTQVNAPGNTQPQSSNIRDYSGIEDYGVDINPQGIPKSIFESLFPEGNLQDIIKNSKTQKDYNINATKDLVENLPGGVVKEAIAPAVALGMSPFYDGIQAATRTTESDINRAMQTGALTPREIAAEAYGLAFDRENPLSSAVERFTGAAAPLAERFANFNNPFTSSAAASEMSPTTTEDITVDGGLLNNGSFMESQINPRVIAAENNYYNQGKMPPEFLGDRLRMNMELGNARGFMGPGFAQGGLASMFTRRR